MQALDDEDVAHLDAIEEQKREVEYKVKSGIEREVALFHAAREDRGLVQTVVEEDQVGVDDGDDEDGGDINDDRGHKKSPSSNGDQILAAAAVPAAKKQIVPKFTIKKKRKRVDPESKDDATQKKISGVTELKSGKDDDAEKQCNEEEKPKNNVADLLGLGCYGSDSDSD